MSDARGGGRAVLSRAPAATGPEDGSATVFLSAADVKMVAVVDVRAWVGDIGHVRIGVAAIQGRVSTLLRLGRDLQQTAAKTALVCELESGDTVLLEGGAVERTGRFSSFVGPSAAVSWRGVDIPILDVNALYRWIEASVWERSALTRERG